MSICLFRLSLLLFLEKKIATKLSQYIFIGLDIESTTSRPEIKILNQIIYVIAL
jgi:hypothetical protein